MWSHMHVRSYASFVKIDSQQFPLQPAIEAIPIWGVLMFSKGSNI